MSNRQFDVLVVGNAGVDTNVYLPGGDIDFGVEANFTENITYVGNAGGYAARGYAQLGKRTAFIGYLGEDQHGRFIQDEFVRDGIDMAGLFTDPQGTAHSINFMYQDGRRKNFYDGKGHMHLQPDIEVCQAVFSQAELAHFNIPNWARHLLPLARELGLTVAVDLQDVVTADDPYRQDFIHQADILFFSAVNYDDPKPLIDAFLALKPGLIIISGMGDRGCALGTQSGVRYFPPVDLETPIIDTNGAGDALAVGFLCSYLMDGYSLEDSILRGQIAARHACTLKATSSQLISMTQLEAYYGNQREVI
jgi:sugar/nucleoside kinase (ribokinase family)